MAVATLWYDTKETGQLILFFFSLKETTFARSNRSDEYDDDENVYTSARDQRRYDRSDGKMDDIWIPTFSDCLFLLVLLSPS